MSLKKPNLYLDVDGVLLGKEDPDSSEICLARHAEELVGLCLDRCNVYWLTTHCKEGDAARVLKVLSFYSPPSMMSLLKKVHPSTWNIWKTEAIDFGSNFYWVDDQPLTQELGILEKRRVRDRLIQANTRKNPDDLKRVINQIRAWPLSSLYGQVSRYSDK